MDEGDSGSTKFSFTVTSDKVASEDITFEVNTPDVTALSPLDYAVISSVTFTIPAGSTTVSVDVDVVGEMLVENDETFQVNLSNEAIANDHT